MGRVDAKHILVQKEQCAERLILRRRADMTLDREPRQEPREFGGTHFGRVPLSVEQAVSANPVDVRLLGPRAVVSCPYEMPHSIEQLRRLAVHMAIERGFRATRGEPHTGPRSRAQPR